MPEGRPKSQRRAKPAALSSEASESHILAASAFELARNLGIPNILVLADLCNLSDDRIEYQIRDRYSFGRLLRLALVAHGLEISLGLLWRQTGPSDNPGAQML